MIIPKGILTEKLCKVYDFNRIYNNRFLHRSIFFIHIEAGTEWCFLKITPKVLERHFLISLLLVNFPQSTITRNYNVII